MISIVKRFLINNSSVSNLCRLNNSQLCVKGFRHTHFLPNKCLSTVNLHAKSLLSTHYSNSVLRPIDSVSVRYKSNQKQTSSRNDDDSDDGSDDDDDDNSLNEFKEGDGSDKNLAKIKSKTLRLDAIIKAGLGLNKKKIEKLFYESKLRVNGKKVTKKSMDILKDCEIDVIKGPSPDNSDYLIIGRIEVLAVKSEGLQFVLTVRRNKNLVVENYDGARYTDVE